MIADDVRHERDDECSAASPANADHNEVLRAAGDTVSGAEPTRGGILGPLMFGGRFERGTESRPTRLTITPSPPRISHETLLGRADWGWARTHSGGGFGPEIAARVGPMGNRSVIREEFTPSEIAAYEWCDWLHFWRYRHGMERTTVDLRRAGDPLTAAQLGQAFHRFVATFDERVGLEELLRRAIQEQDPRADLVAEVGRLRPAAEHHLASALEARARASDEQRRETPFSMELDQHEQVYLTGRYDLIFRESDVWTIVDYKSTSIPFGDDTLEESALREVARRYEAQLAIYALVLREVMPSQGKRVGSCVLALPHARAEIELLVTDEWLDGWCRRVLEHVRRIRRGLYSRQPAHVAWRCAGCPMLRLCAPEPPK